MEWHAAARCLLCVVNLQPGSDRSLIWWSELKAIVSVTCFRQNEPIDPAAIFHHRLQTLLCWFCQVNFSWECATKHTAPSNPPLVMPQREPIPEICTVCWIFNHAALLDWNLEWKRPKPYQEYERWNEPFKMCCCWKWANSTTANMCRTLCRVCLACYWCLSCSQIFVSASPQLPQLQLGATSVSRV